MISLEMKILLTLMITELIKNEPEVLDYAFVYEMISIWEEEEIKVKDKVKKIIQDEHKNNFDIEVDYTNSNLKDIGIKKTVSPNFDKYKSKKIDKLVDKNFKKLDTKVKSQMLNAINTKNVNEVVNLLKTTIKTEKKNQSLTSSLMRVFRTENTKMRTQLKFDLKEELVKEGFKIKRRWVHTLFNPTNVILDSYTPREEHIMMNGQLEDNAGYFHGYDMDTRGPGMWGVPEEDINCRCDVDFVLDE